jgi:hypothetical protein
MLGRLLQHPDERCGDGDVDRGGGREWVKMYRCKCRGMEYMSRMRAKQYS